MPKFKSKKKESSTQPTLQEQLLANPLFQHQQQLDTLREEQLHEEELHEEQLHQELRGQEQLVPYHDYTPPRPVPEQKMSKKKMAEMKKKRTKELAGKVSSFKQTAIQADSSGSLGSKYSGRMPHLIEQYKFGYVAMGMATSTEPGITYARRNVQLRANHPEIKNEASSRTRDLPMFAGESYSSDAQLFEVMQNMVALEKAGYVKEPDEDGNEVTKSKPLRETIEARRTPATALLPVYNATVDEIHSKMHQLGVFDEKPIINSDDIVARAAEIAPLYLQLQVMAAAGKDMDMVVPAEKRAFIGAAMVYCLGLVGLANRCKDPSPEVQRSGKELQAGAFDFQFSKIYESKLREVRNADRENGIA